MKIYMDNSSSQNSKELPHNRLHLGRLFLAFLLHDKMITFSHPSPLSYRYEITSRKFIRNKASIQINYKNSQVD